VQATIYGLINSTILLFFYAFLSAVNLRTRREHHSELDPKDVRGTHIHVFRPQENGSRGWGSLKNNVSDYPDMFETISWDCVAKNKNLYSAPFATMLYHVVDFFFTPELDNVYSPPFEEPKSQRDKFAWLPNTTYAKHGVSRC
jgi:hypothetical protein